MCCFFFSLIPATMVAVIGYLVLFSTTKVEGIIQKFGKILAIWLFVIASFFPMMGVYVAISGPCPLIEMMEQNSGFIKK